MPSSTHSSPKKRRRDDDDTDSDFLLSLYVEYCKVLDKAPIQQLTSSGPSSPHAHEQHQHPHHMASPRKVIPYSSPLSKKIRINNSSDEQTPYQQTSLPPHHTRSPSSKQQSAPKTINLSPCHICHRKPTKKSDLDSYADCESCGERTCYICIRQCLGWKGTQGTVVYDHQQDLMRDEDHNEHPETDEGDENRAPSDSERSFCMEDAPSRDGKRDDIGGPVKHGGIWDRGRGKGKGHWDRICSQCCVEKGPQGEVVCLGCLAA